MSSNKIKVLIVLPSMGGYGGMEASSLGLAEAIRRRADFEARICFWREPPFQLQPSAKMMFDGEEVIYADGIFDRDLAHAMRWADIIHLQAVIPVVAILARLRGKRLIINPARPTHRSLLSRVATALAHERWQHRMPRLRDGWNPPNERKGFVFAGRWLANKGLDTLLDAYAQADLDRKQWPLVLMGDGPLRSLIEYAIQKRGIDGIKVLGFVDEATKAETIKNARWMIIPLAARESLHLSAMEAGHLGVPCIFNEGDSSALAALLTQAAALTEPEYTERAERRRAELKKELATMDSYPLKLRQLFSGQENS